MNNCQIPSDRLPISNIQVVRYTNSNRVIIAFQDVYNAKYEGEFRYYRSMKGLYILVNKKRHYFFQNMDV